MKPSKSASLSDLARSLGVSPPAIRKAIQAGRIPASLIGTKELASGRKVPLILDVTAARAAFIGAAVPASRAVASTEPAPAASDDESPIPSIGESRARKEFAKARMAEIEVERESGRLVDAEAVRTKLATMIVTARNRLLSVPSKAKSRLPHLSVDDVDVLSGLIREALEGVADAQQDEAIRSAAEGSQT